MSPFNGMLLVQPYTLIALYIIDALVNEIAWPNELE
jgi:hypothetical protein